MDLHTALFENEWKYQEKELAQLSELHAIYCKKINDVKSMQAQLSKSIAKHRKELKKIRDTIPQVPVEKNERYVPGALNKLQLKVGIAENALRNFEDVLPHENGFYLKTILGSVNVSLLSKKDKFSYKDNYENFKATITFIIMILTFSLMIGPPYKVLDGIQQALLVWYYATVSIREHILQMNGSRIKGWWIAHHFISTVASGVLLTWPDGYTYQQIRMHYHIFILYMSFTQLVQGYYQKGCLYRLKALGDRHSMALTVEGFHSWMWRGLTFVLPFLIVGYMFEFYMFIVLWSLSCHEQCIEWQVLFSSVFMLVIFFGNSSTIYVVLRDKINDLGWRERVIAKADSCKTFVEYVMKNKYSYNFQEHFLQMKEVVKKRLEEKYR